MKVLSLKKRDDGYVNLEMELSVNEEQTLLLHAMFDLISRGQIHFVGEELVKAYMKEVIDEAAANTFKDNLLTPDPKKYN